MYKKQFLSDYISISSIDIFGYLIKKIMKKNISDQKGVVSQNAFELNLVNRIFFPS